MFKEKLLEDALRLYAGQHVLDRVLREGRQALEFAAHPATAAIMFIDLKGGVPLEPIKLLTPELLHSWLAQFHTLIADTIAEHKGVLDGFTGDAVLAYWDIAPDAEQAALALRCAERMVASVEALSRSQPEFPSVSLIIGLNTGLVRLGNHGTRKRMRHTVMGDVVNFASRLCNRCNEYGLPVLIGQATVRLAPDVAAVSEVDTIRIKGKDHPVTLYTFGSSYVRPKREAMFSPGI
ncbi:MAG: putative Adenylate cyclase [Betaproteobacteria bacterium]|nr:putative Adenylate cyclase [Betaproteobacteria bacterium]